MCCFANGSRSKVVRAAREFEVTSKSIENQTAAPLTRRILCPVFSFFFFVFVRFGFCRNLFIVFLTGVVCVRNCRYATSAMAYSRIPALA